MTISENTVRRTLYIAAFFLLIVILVRKSTEPDLYIQKIRKSYKGVIVKKYFLKSTHLTIRTTDGGNVDIAAIGTDLQRESAVGDTIEKILGDNYVLLTKNGVKLKLIYVYIPYFVRQDSRWPIEWKDKWRESSNTGKSLKIVFAGDLMLDRGTRSTIQRNDPAFLFENIKPFLSHVDFSIANLECVIAETSLKPRDKRFVFQGNPEWLSTIRASGITHLTLANNHSFDYGEEGFRQTVSNLTRYGIQPIGYNANNSPSCLPTIIDKNEIHLAIFSSCSLDLQDTLICNESASVLSDNIRAFKKIHPDYLVFVCLHWGIELKSTPTPEQVEQAHLIINAGADAIIGHHPHVVQTIEQYNGKYIFYSIGNFIFDNNYPPCNTGIFSIFSLSEKGIASVDILPFTMVHSKPILMSPEESALFMKEIGSAFQNITIKQNDSLWELF